MNRKSRFVTVCHSIYLRFFYTFSVSNIFEDYLEHEKRLKISRKTRKGFKSSSVMKHVKAVVVLCLTSVKSVDLVPIVDNSAPISSQVSVEFINVEKFPLTGRRRSFALL